MVQAWKRGHRSNTWVRVRGVKVILVAKSIRMISFREALVQVLRDFTMSHLIANRGKSQSAATLQRVPSNFAKVLVVV